MLDDSQIAKFWQDGYLMVNNAVDASLLKALQLRFSAWQEESLDYDEPYGNTIDGRPRFDLEPGHSAISPGLRRINAPMEISQVYYDAMFSSPMTQCVAQLIGPNVKFHHGKINSKLPGSKTAVKWHQDFCFTPHSNDDLVTALLMVDEVTPSNGPLEVIPGSHRGDIHTLWHDGVFSGAVAEDIASECQKKAVSCVGDAGSVCLMHTRLLHGSAANLSELARTLYICVYSAEDAIPNSANPMPNKFQGLIVNGEKTNKVRSISYDMDLPEVSKTASFFDQQSK